MLRAIMTGIAVVLIALAANAHDPEGKWDAWFARQNNMRGGSLIGPRLVVRFEC